MIIITALQNKAFLKRSNDILGTLLLTTQTEMKVVKFLQGMSLEIEKVIDSVFSTKEIMESSLTLEKWQMEQIVNLAVNPAQLQAQMNALQQTFLSNMRGLMNGVINQAYRQGSNAAQIQINRIQPSKQSPSYSGLSPEDLRMIQLLQDADFSKITTLGADQIATAKTIILNGLNNGLNQKQMVEKLRNAVHNSEYNARRIVRTEITAVANTATKKRYLDSGITYWQWNTSIDELVCNVCGALHGKVVKIGDPFNEYLSGVALQQNRGNIITIPPAHPFCRCGMSPAFGKEEKPVVKQKPKIEVKPVLAGFDRYLRDILQEYFALIPSQVKQQVKVLNGYYQIKKTNGNVVEDLEVKAILSPATIQKFSKASGLYIGGKYNRVYVGSNAGTNETTHEVGHAVFDEYIKKNRSMLNNWTTIHQIHLDNGDFLTPRCSSDIDEHFADAFRFYLVEPEILRLKYPEIYEFLRKSVFLGNEKDTIITLEDNSFLIKNHKGMWTKYEATKN